MHFGCITGLKCRWPTLIIVPEYILSRQRWRTEAAAALLMGYFRYAGCVDIVPVRPDLDLTLWIHGMTWDLPLKASKFHPLKASAPC